MLYLLLSRRDLYPTLTLQTRVVETSWVNGTPLPGTMPVLQFTVEGNEPFTWCDYFRPAANIPLFSPRMEEALASAGVDNVDYYEAIVTHRASGASRPYRAANVIGQIAALDRDRSVFQQFPGSELIADEIENLVLREDRAGNVQLFRLAEYDLLIVASERVKRALESIDAIGVVLLPPEEWDGFAT